MTTVAANDPSVIQTLVQSPVYLGEDHVRQNVLPAVLATIVAVTGFYNMAVALAPNVKSLQDRRKLAYQATNMMTNLTLGLMGVYFQYFFLPSNLSEAERIEGWEDLYILGAAQIGYQIWSILMALFFVEEPPEMLVHHVAAIMAASKGAFLTNGFRYYAPVALGIIELSSVPLAVMNSFKNNQTWREAYPQYYLASRLIFTICFLIIRIGIFVPPHLEYLQYAFLVNWHSQTQHVGAAYRVFMSISWMGAVFLLVLQLYWGYLIVMGLSKFVMAQIQVKSKLVEKKTV